MKFAFIPKGSYKIGQVIKVQGRKAQVVAYSHTGKNIQVAMLEGRKERMLCVCTDSQPVTGI